MPDSVLAKLSHRPFSVEALIEMDFYDGVLTSFFRSNELSIVTRTAADFVFGPARSDWYRELGYHSRMFLVSPVTDAPCNQALTGAKDGLADTPEHLEALQALARPFTHDDPAPGHVIQGRYLCKFTQSFQSIDAWELVGVDTITQALVAERWPLHF